MDKNAGKKMTDSIDITKHTTYLTIAGVRKRARDWHRPEVCTWDAFRSRIKRYRDDPTRYTLAEIINKQALGRAARTGTRITRRRAPAQEAKKPMGISCPVMRMAVCGPWTA